MKVCYITPQVIKAVSGGLRTQVEFNALYLKKLGVDITFFNPWQEYAWQKFDLVHIFRADWETYNMALFLHQRKIPFAVTPVFFSKHHPLLNRLVLTICETMQKFYQGINTELNFLKNICRLGSLILPNTKAEGQLIKTLTGKSCPPVMVVPNGVEERFSEADAKLFQQKYNLSDFILSVGNLGYVRKNMLNLIKALEITRQPAVLIGKLYKNSYGSQCLARINQIPTITWIDALDHDDPLLASAYAACKVFALPSYFETPGIAAMEAALTGARIVITPYGGTTEYFKDMVEYVKPKKIAAIAKALRIADEKKKDSKLAQHILREYTMPVVAKRMLKAYDDMIRSNLT